MKPSYVQMIGTWDVFYTFSFFLRFLMKYCVMFGFSIEHFKDLELNVRHADLLYLLEPSCVIEAHTLIKKKM